MVVMKLISALMLSLISMSLGEEVSISKHPVILTEHSRIMALKCSAEERKTTIAPAFQGEFTEILPTCIEKPDPVYPDSALEAGLEGTTVLLVYLDSLGTITNLELHHSSGYDILDQAAEDAAWESKWTPAERRKGEPIDCLVMLGYTFTLPE